MTKHTMLQVGQPYNPNKIHWPEGVDYNFRNGQHELRIFMRSPNPQEIKSAETGPAHFALAVISDVIFLCYRFDPAIPWSDCGFSFYLVPEDERILPEPSKSKEERAVLTTILIDAENGIIKAMRISTFSPRFTQKLHQAIIDQAAKSWPGEEEYVRQAEAVYRKYTSANMASKMAIARCRGGE